VSEDTLLLGISPRRKEELAATKSSAKRASLKVYDIILLS
jgi:hypothetical protein